MVSGGFHPDVCLRRLCDLTHNMTDKRYCVIMAGGTANHFWPISRESRPKQFLDIAGDGKSFLRMTFERFSRIIPKENIIIVTLDRFGDLVKEQIPELPAENLLLEPHSRNTAPCIAYSTFTILKRDPDAIILTTPADHIITDETAFRKAVDDVIEYAASNNALMTLGISPTVPDTGYGYIKYDTEEGTGFESAFRVRKFVEKPDLKTAKRYLASGEYLWNSGMFIWKASAVLREIREKLPELYQQLETIEQAIGTDREEDVLKEVFGQIQPISIDYGVMEKAKNVYVLPSSFGWDDVGSWLAVGRINPANDAGNVVRGDVVAVNSTRCIVEGGSKMIAMVGLEDTIIVDTKDALLVCAKESAGDIRKVLETLKAENRTELL